MTFWTLIRSIFLVSLCAHPILLGSLGVADSLIKGNIDGLFAVAAVPMALAFFGLPVLFTSLFVVVPVYYALSRFGYRKAVPLAVFAVGAGILIYLFVAKPPPTGAMPGYDQAAEAFSAAALVIWSLYAYSRMEFRQS